MTSQEKRFGRDLLKALDIGLGNEVKPDSEYDITECTGETRKEILRSVRELIKMGYEKHENTV